MVYISGPLLVLTQTQELVLSIRTEQTKNRSYHVILMFLWATSIQSSCCEINAFSRSLRRCAEFFIFTPISARFRCMSSFDTLRPSRQVLPKLHRTGARGATLCTVIRCRIYFFVTRHSILRALSVECKHFQRYVIQRRENRIS